MHFYIFIPYCNFDILLRHFIIPLNVFFYLVSFSCKLLSFIFLLPCMLHYSTNCSIYIYIYVFETISNWKIQTTFIGSWRMPILSFLLFFLLVIPFFFVAYYCLFVFKFCRFLCDFSTFLKRYFVLIKLTNYSSKTI